MKWMKLIGVLSLAAALCVPAAQAQNRDPRVNPPATPLPPLSPIESSSKSSGEKSVTNAPEPAPATPDTRPLSGVENFSLGGSRARSFLLPSFSFTQNGDTNGRTAAGSTVLDAASLLHGSLSFQRIWRRYQFNTSYGGGATLYAKQTGLNTSFHDLSVSQMIDWRRWKMLLRDDFGYSPEAAFGGAGGAGALGMVGELGGIMGSLNPLFAPSQTILTGRASRISNTFVGEVQYNFSPRASFTAAGSYAVLHFMDTGFVNSRDAMFHTGYNYGLSSKDTVAFIYGFSHTMFDGVNGAQDTHLAHVAYGRRITGRLAFQVSAGPQIIQLNELGLGSTRQVTWSLFSSLTYRLRRTEFGLSYLHGVTAGSGVFFGAESHYFNGSVNREFSRSWTGNWNFGYSRNGVLQNTISSGSPLNKINAWYTGAVVSRRIGRHTRMLFTYSLLRQNGNTAICTAGSCGNILLRHTFGVGFDWHPRPIEVD